MANQIIIDDVGTFARVIAELTLAGVTYRAEQNGSTFTIIVTGA